MLLLEQEGYGLKSKKINLLSKSLCFPLCAYGANIQKKVPMNLVKKIKVNTKLLWLLFMFIQTSIYDAISSNLVMQIDSKRSIPSSCATSRSVFALQFSGLKTQILVGAHIEWKQEHNSRWRQSPPGNKTGICLASFLVKVPSSPRSGSQVKGGPIKTVLYFYKKRQYLKKSWDADLFKVFP